MNDSLYFELKEGMRLLHKGWHKDNQDEIVVVACGVQEMTDWLESNGNGNPHKINKSFLYCNEKTYEEIKNDSIEQKYKNTAQIRMNPIQYFEFASNKNMKNVLETVED